MKINFILRESSHGLRRGVFHSFVTVSATVIALTVSAIFVYGLHNLQRATEGLLGTLQMQAFISLTVPEDQHPRLQQELQQIDQRWDILYVSRADAAAEFTREFDPEIFNVLKVNPLPASFRIGLPVEVMHPDSAGQIVNRLQSIEGIEDVIYDKGLLDLIHSGMRKLTLWGLLVTGLTLFIAVGITFNAIRLKIHSQQDAMNLMSLLGATPATLYAVYWIQGAILGILGGCLSAGIILAIRSILRMRIAGTIDIVAPHTYFLIVAGGILGILGGLLAVKKYLKV